MVGTRATQDAGNEEGDDYEPTKEITDPTSELQEKKRVIKTPKHLDSWMTEARHLLLRYLEFRRQKAQAHSVADKIRDLFTLSYQGLPLPEVKPNHGPRHKTPAPDDESSEGETDNVRQ